MRTWIQAAVSCALLAASAAAQCPGFIPTTFLNSTSTTGNELNVETLSDSTANSLTTPTAQDNQASVSVGEAITFRLSSVSGIPGAPLVLAFTPGLPTPAGVFPFGNLHLNIGGGLGAVADGLGLITGVPNAFIAHPGAGQDWTMTGTIGAYPGIAQTCWTFQSVLADPTAPTGVRLSNASLVQIRGQLQSIVPPFGTDGAAVVVNALGATTGGTANFKTSAPAGGFVNPTTPSVSTSSIFTVPFGAGSGPVTFEYPTAPGQPTVSNPDDIRTWFAVVDSTGVLNNPAQGLLALNPSPTTGDRFASLTQTLANATTTHTYSIALNAGDVVEIEAYAMDIAQSGFLDGFGSTYDPGATQGADLALAFRQVNNFLPLTFDQGAIGPFVVHSDDDSGPGFNPRLVFQARATDTYQVLVNASPGNAAAFVTGDYLLNVRAVGNVPSITRFELPGAATATQINARPAGQTVTIIGNNFPVGGGALDVILTPVHGLYAPILVAGVAPTSATALTFTIPALSVPTFCVGSHTVQVSDVGSGYRSLVWDNSAVRPLGIRPELLVVRAPILTTLANTAVVVVNPAIANTASYGTQATAAQANSLPPGHILQFAANGTQTIYMEVLATKNAAVGTANYQALVDTFIETGNASGPCYDPILTIFPPNLSSTFAQNDQDGFFPSAFNWPSGGTPGIGLNAAVLQPTAGFVGAGNGTFTSFVTTAINYLGAGGSNGPGKGYLVHIVVL